MPIKPVTGMTPLPLDSPEDVAALVELLQRPDSDARGLGDHLAFLAGTRPELFRPHQEAVITDMLDRFDVSFADQCLLLGGAPDQCVEHLAQRLRSDRSFGDARALAAIGTAAALSAVAEDVRNGGDRKKYELSGIWVPSIGPAQYRFSPHRRAVRLRPINGPGELAAVDHPVGLPVERVAQNPSATPISWHYLSLRHADVPGLPPWPTDRVHLVGTRATCMWTLHAGIDDSGRYRREAVTSAQPPSAEEEETYRSLEVSGFGLGAVELRPYDADLVYCNGHIQLTPGVVGTAGGPPIGLYANPSCPSCGRLMFHVVSVENRIREYGDGWRSLFICEDCHTVSCNATGWN
ncbi:hypothetical protein [Plantactinospora sp. KLBMP9567]|uniref:hypothetical protein n=1 Tax=Plantactinospora sp. KLBMP9567 TaxID=3085900 RepID=UPI0029815127|nr:hypothetical protein [Plantactinospora sp. KLBMP9567]MDW5326939.1 hypothetical protein [Plantactinospora sp. KLBMP9567]